MALKDGWLLKAKNIMLVINFLFYEIFTINVHNFHLIKKKYLPTKWLMIISRKQNSKS